jgi:hypothetical protein
MGHQGVAAQFFSLGVQTYISFTPLDLQIVINNHSNVFGEISKGLSHTWDHAHGIHLQLRNLTPNIRPYRYSYAQKSEIEHMIQEMLEPSVLKHMYYNKGRTPSVTTHTNTFNNHSHN